jgi:hypothetical protein
VALLGNWSHLTQTGNLLKLQRHYHHPCLVEVPCEELVLCRTHWTQMSQALAHDPMEVDLWNSLD